VEGNKGTVREQIAPLVVFPPFLRAFQDPPQLGPCLGLLYAVFAAYCSHGAEGGPRGGGQLQREGRFGWVEWGFPIFGKRANSKEPDDRNGRVSCKGRFDPRAERSNHLPVDEPRWIIDFKNRPQKVTSGSFPAALRSEKLEFLPSRGWRGLIEIQGTLYPARSLSRRMVAGANRAPAQDLY
jgi:hypothetical protein